MADSFNSKLMHAPAEKIYQAFTDPKALEEWLVPGEMTGKVHHFDLREGGGYEMSLYYPEDDETAKGKTAAKEDRYSTKYLQLIPNKKIVEAIKFETSDPEFAGEMILEVSIEETANGTIVLMQFKNIPPGIRPEDNEAGTKSSLEKLARLVE